MSNIRKEFAEHKPRFVRRIIWRVVNATLYRMAGGVVGWPVRRELLRLFGAKVDSEAYIYARCRIYAPWNLTVGRSLIGPRTDLYCKGRIVIGDKSVISQGTTICTASHSTKSYSLPLKVADVTIGDNVWVASEAFVGPGVYIADGAVVAARAVVFESVEALTIVRGNPASPYKSRKIID